MVDLRPFGMDLKKSSELGSEWTGSAVLRSFVRSFGMDLKTLKVLVRNGQVRQSFARSGWTEKAQGLVRN